MHALCGRLAARDVVVVPRSHAAGQSGLSLDNFRGRREASNPHTDVHRSRTDTNVHGCPHIFNHRQMQAKKNAQLPSTKRRSFFEKLSWIGIPLAQARNRRTLTEAIIALSACTTSCRRTRSVVQAAKKKRILRECRDGTMRAQ